MALINNIWVHVTDEQVGREVEMTEHPTETGIDVTDNFKRQPVTLSISGKIVDTDTLKSHDALAQIYNLQINGSLITYSGRNLLKNMMIQSFNSAHPNTNAGGLDFDMTLKEVRIATSSYSSTAKTATAAEVTKVQTETKAGTQQITVGDGNAVYHTMAEGDSLYTLVALTYRELYTGSIGENMKWVYENNPDAFDSSVNYIKPVVGARALMGYKNIDKTEATQYGTEASYLY